MIEPKIRRGPRLKVLRARRADIVLRRLQARPIGGHFSASGIDRHQLIAETGDSGVAQQRLNDHLRLLVIAFAEFVVSNAALRVDEVERRPILIVEGAPDRIVGVDGDRIVDPHVLRGAAHVVDVVLERELWRVHADHHQSLVFVFLAPRADVRKGTEPVDAGVRPEVDQNHFSAQAGGRQWL